MNSDTMTIEQFADLVDETPVPTDVELESSWEWDLSDNFDVTFGEKIAGPLPMYQAKSLFGQPGIDLTGTRRLQKFARDGDLRAEMALRRQVAQLNVAMKDVDFESNELIARTVLDDGGRQVIGGIVTDRYTPLTHRQLVDLMLENVGFEDAIVHRNRVDAHRLDATVLVEGTKWEVDGGIKLGMVLKNGQFGDVSYGWMAMLFELVCTNGMMDVVDSEKLFRRHVGLDDVDMAADLVSAMQRGDEMFAKTRAASEVEDDTVNTLIELHRRNLLSRGALRSSIESIDEMSAQQRAESVWGTARVITAAARRYSFTQFDRMGRLAGRLVFNGVDAVLESRPVPVDAPSYAEVYEEFVSEVEAA